MLDEWSGRKQRSALGSAQYESLRSSGVFATRDHKLPDTLLVAGFVGIHQQFRERCHSDGREWAPALAVLSGRIESERYEQPIAAGIDPLAEWRCAKLE